MFIPNLVNPSSSIVLMPYSIAFLLGKTVLTQILLVELYPHLTPTGRTQLPRFRADMVQICMPTSFLQA